MHHPALCHLVLTIVWLAAVKRAWQRVREVLLRVSAELLCPPQEASCTVCSSSLTESELWRCMDCGSEAYFCATCVQKVHQTTAVVHVLERWEAGEFQQSIPDGFCWNWSRKDHDCEMSYHRVLKVFDCQGRCHDVSIQFCSCETEVATLLRYSLWPATVKRPQSAVSTKLMDMICRLQLECGVSLKAICTAIQQSSLSSECQDLYRHLVKESYEEYRHLRYQMTTLRHLGADVTDGAQCPICPQEDGVLVLAADGLFGLPRKKSSGRSFEGPKHNNRFFSPQDDVDAFVKEQQHTPEEGCANFQAGSALRSKLKNAKLDETGVFGMACKHEHPRRFLSLKRGESLSNAVYLMKELQEDLGGNKKLVFMYDIGCKLKPHLEKFFPNLLDNTTIAVPAFHAYGHGVACQISHACRNVEGAGLCDGEQLERLWSFLRRFGKVTKEMTPSHRIDLLTDALLHYSEKIRKNQAKALCSKAEKTNSVEEEAKTEIAEIMKQTGLTELDVQRWAEHYKSEAKKTIDWTWEEDYVQKLLEHQHLEVLNRMATSDPELRARLEKSERQLQTIERKRHVGGRWTLNTEASRHLLSAIDDKKRQHALQAMYRLVLERRFLCGLVRKYADGQKIAIRLSKKINVVGQKIKNKVKEYNSTGTSSALVYHEVIQIDNPIWSTMVHSEKDADISVKQRLFVLLNTAERASEEREYLSEECMAGKLFYEKQLVEVEKCLLPDSLPSVSSREDKGARAALLAKKREFLFLHSKYVNLVNLLRSTDVIDEVNSADSDISTDEEEDYDEEEDQAVHHSLPE
ncbi:uncharacterized protein LOC133457248 isoform X2 [Cololabis saira]|uniref:uncharacterized protein LOC133457248 isoform X2 n=1 Tax=Cololabis saira TaxID=129043 RepID=UPI002AD30DAB|nr:uncharacterized protein LOC133457248 isoform X2 [Cololabis saira]